MGDHLVGAVEGTEGTPGCDVRQASGELSINDTPLLGSVLIISGREFRKDSDHAAGDPEFQVFAIPAASLPADGGGATSGFLVSFLTVTVMKMVNPVIV